MEKRDLIRNERAEKKERKRLELEALEGLTSNELFERRNALNVEMQGLQSEINQIKVSLGRITGELKRRDQPGPTIDVSEHAVVQYLDRIEGIDVSAVRRKIREAIPTDAKRGDKFTVDGITYVIAANGRVTTVYRENPDDGPYRE